MGVGDSLEAAYTLQAPLAAGRWHLVGDGILLGTDANQADVEFEVVWRAGNPDAGNVRETTLCTFDHHFVRRVPGGFLATPYEDQASAPAAPAQPGDQLVLRISTTGGDPGVLFVPNGDGARGQGAVPHLDLPR